MTRNSVQSRWEVIVANKESSYAGAKQSDKILFILRSVHSDCNALVCRIVPKKKGGLMDIVVNERPNLDSKVQHFQIVTWP